MNMKFKKLKTDKTAGEKLEVDNGVTKKRKVELSNGHTKGQNNTKCHAIEAEALSAKKTSKAEAATSLLQYFKEFTKENDNLRIHAVLQLLQQVTKTRDTDKRSKELSYSLKRLIRGCGAATHISRIGFFTGLVAFLKVFSVADISFDQIMDNMEKELHVGTTIANKEDADAVVGRILICGALIHADRVATASGHHIEKVTMLLLESTKYRSYHVSLAFSFLLELLEMLTQTQFETIVWPLLQKKLTKPWPKQNLQTVHCLITIQKRFPNVVSADYMKNHFGGSELLNPSSFEMLYKIFWQNSDTTVLTHPAFEEFGTYIAGSTQLSQFWAEAVEPALLKPAKFLEIETVKIITDILNNLSIEKTKIADLLSTNFIRMVVAGVRNLKQKKNETMKAFYDEFFEALVACCAKKAVTDTERVDVIHRLLLPPGTFNIEKYTGTRIVHQLINNLGEKGVLEMFQLYKSIFLAAIPKNKENAEETWLNFERQNAGYMMQNLLMHKSVAQAYIWREEQLRFFVKCGVFYVDDSTMNICKKDASGAFSKDFGEQCKNMFYSSLKRKLMDLQKESELLLNLVNFCNEQIQKKHACKYFRVKHFDDLLHQAWNSMYNVVGRQVGFAQETKHQSNSKNKLQVVFHILLSNMGLQLFREPEMARLAIEDLLKCMEHAKQREKLRKKQKSKIGADENADPEWIEVVIDIFLHLLSHDASDLRNIVNALFPHLCANLTLTAVHQILAMLDMKDGQNPLSLKGQQDDDDEKDNLDREDNSKKSDGCRTNNTDEEDSGDSEEEDEDDDDDEDEDEVEEEVEEKITESDKLRNAVSQALISTGAAAGQDDDLISVDLNDVTEEDGKKLDEALANAFKALKKSGSSTAKDQKTKSWRVQTTSLMHFRIRVLDLIDIYLQQKPHLLLTIEIMLVLYDMLQFCFAEELKPLQNKVEKVLTKLTTLKFDISDGELNEDNLVDFIRMMLEKKIPAAAFDFNSKLRNKCIVFLIGHLNKLSEAKEVAESKVLAFFQNAIEEYIKSRNPIITVSLLSEIFRLRWPGVWALAISLARLGVNMHTRAFRRIQIFEIFTILYKNVDILKENKDVVRKKFKKIEKPIQEHIKSMNAAESAKLSAKEFQTLLELILCVRQANGKLELTSNLTCPATCELLQNLRSRIKLASPNIYRRFCATFNLKLINNIDINVSINQQNSMQCIDDEEHEDLQRHKDEEGGPQNENQTVESNKTAKKRKKDEDLRKAKKMKKQQRMEAFSKGFSDVL